MNFIIASLIIYFYAAIPFSLLVGFLYHVDIRKKGSQNIGGTNLGRICGKKAFIFAFIGDLSKGLFVILIASLFTINPIYLFAFALLGHSFSIYINFKGGKGVATAFGFVLGYTFWQAIFAIIVFLIVLKISKYVSLSAIIAIFGYLVLSFFYHSLWYSLAIFIVFITITYLHRENLIRIKNHLERKITWM